MAKICNHATQAENMLRNTDKTYRCQKLDNEDRLRGFMVCDEFYG